jgi:hypothetical protein
MDMPASTRDIAGEGGYDQTPSFEDSNDKMSRSGSNDDNSTNHDSSGSSSDGSSSNGSNHHYCNRNSSTRHKKGHREDSLDNVTDVGGEAEGSEEREYVPPCLLFGREPVDRVISFYYERCYTKDGCPGQGRLINELSVAEFEYIVREYRTVRKILIDEKSLGISGNSTKREVAMIMDEGMSDAVCKTIANENISRGKILEFVAEPDIVVLPPPGRPLTDQAVATALSNVKHCVVGLLEDLPESKGIVNHWFPWLDFGEYTYRRTLLALGDMRSKAWDLRPELKDIIVRYNQCDIKLYETMVDIFNKERNVIHSKELLM